MIRFDVTPPDDQFMGYVWRHYWTPEKLPWFIAGGLALAILVAGWFMPVDTTTSTRTITQAPLPVVVHVTVSPSAPPSAQAARPNVKQPVVLIEPVAEQQSQSPTHSTPTTPRPSAAPQATPKPAPSPPPSPQPSPSSTRSCVTAADLITICH